ncbi:MAG: hypothetical protein ACI9DO_003450, partial [Reinekea sp.]
MQKHNVCLCDDYRVKSSGDDVLLLASACLTHHEERSQRQTTCHTRCNVTDRSQGRLKRGAPNNAKIDNSKLKINCDRHSRNYLSNNTPPNRKNAFFRCVNPLLLISVLFIMSSAQVAAQSLADSDLNNQSLYASGYITAG